MGRLPSWARPSPAIRYALGVLLAALLASNGVTYLASVNYYHREQAAQQRQGAVLEAKLCTTLGRLAALAPPPGSPQANPSRSYDQQLHAVLAQLGPDVGCERTGR